MSTTLTTPANPFADLGAPADDPAARTIRPTPRRRSSNRLDFRALAERFGWATCGLGLGVVVYFYPWPFVVLGGLYVLGYLFMARGASTAFGSARFATHADMEAGGLFGEKGLILGRAQPERLGIVRAFVRLYTAPLSESALVCMQFRAALVGGTVGGTPLIRLPTFTHLMTVAPPGAGKGVGQVIPTLLCHFGSTVVIDPKAENYKATARARRRHLGNKIVRLDPFGVAGPVAGSARLNPLDFINAKSNPMCADQAASLAEALVVQSAHESEPHWSECSKVAIMATVLYVATYATGKERTLATVCDLLTDADAFAGMAAAMRDEDGTLEKSHAHFQSYPLLKRFGGQMGHWKERELGSVLSSTCRHLSWMNSPVVSEHLSESTFDPRWLQKTATTAYLILPPKYLTTLSRLLRLWIASIYGKLTEAGAQEDKTVLFLLDEAASLGSMPALYQAVTLGRGYGIRVWLVLQSMGQLKSIFPHEGQAQSVEASIDHRIFFGVRDYATAEFVSNYLGQATVQVESTSTNQGESTTGSLANLIAKSAGGYSRSTSTGTGTTTNEVGRKLLMPDEILRLRANIAIVLAKGVPPIKCELAKFYQTPELADAVRANQRAEVSEEGNS